MSYLFPYAGSGRPMPKIKTKPPAPKITLPKPVAPHPQPESRPKPQKAVRTRPERPTLRQILWQVACDHGLPTEALTGPDRRTLLVRARRDFIVRAKGYGYGFIRIGRTLNRDHTTCLYHYEQHLKKAQPDS